MNTMKTFRAVLGRKLTWVIGIPIILLIIAVAGPFIYLRMVSADGLEPLSFDQISKSSFPATTTAPMPVADQPGAQPDPSATPASGEPGVTTTAPATSGVATTAATTAPASAASPLAGTWQVGGGSEARYGIDDTLLGQATRVVGRTTEVSGTMHISEMTISAAHLVVNLQTVSCGCMHDPMYRQLLETSKFPSATFDLSAPIVLQAPTASNAAVTYPAAGTFTIHGNARPVSFSIQIKVIDGRLVGIGSIPIDLASFDVQPPPDAGPVAGITNPTIDLRIALDKLG